MAESLKIHGSTIIVVARDRFSTTERCVDSIRAHTSEGTYELIVVMGGAPKSLEQKLRRRYERHARLVFEKRFLNPAESRNIGLRAAKTPLAVLMDNDVHPRAGWLEALLGCQAQTHAAMVVPVILEPGNKIHTAGNDLFISREGGRTFGQKTLRYYQVRYEGAMELERRLTDYGELHCQLVEVEMALRLGVYDEHIQEAGEVDSGLTWKKAGRAMWFEPAAVVLYDKPDRIRHAEDIRFFAWRWDMRKILAGYKYFEKKWGMDISDYGNFKDFLVSYNCKLGLVPRVFPNCFGLLLDRFCRKLSGATGKVRSKWRMWKAAAWGYGEWEKEFRKSMAERGREDE